MVIKSELGTMCDVEIVEGQSNTFEVIVRQGSWTPAYCTNNSPMDLTNLYEGIQVSIRNSAGNQVRLPIYVLVPYTMENVYYPLNWHYTTDGTDGSITIELSDLDTARIQNNDVVQVTCKISERLHTYKGKARIRLLPPVPSEGP